MKRWLTSGGCKLEYVEKPRIVTEWSGDGRSAHLPQSLWWLSRYCSRAPRCFRSIVRRTGDSPGLFGARIAGSGAG